MEHLELNRIVTSFVLALTKVKKGSKEGQKGVKKGSQNGHRGDWRLWLTGIEFCATMDERGGGR